MVGKLIKHELYSMFRIASIPALIMVLLAILSRITISTSNYISFLLILFYIFSVVITVFIGYFFGISSFYQSLFTGTGYLTLSLPITPDQLIWSKLISAITVLFSSIIVCILSACVFFIGLPSEVYAQIGEIFSELGEAINYFASAEPAFFFEVIVYIILGVPMALLIFYAVMSVGQLFTTKNRKAVSILLYVGIIFVWNIFSRTIFIRIDEAMLEVSIHLYMWINIAFSAAVDVGCYFLVRYIIRNKVNLIT